MPSPYRVACSTSGKDEDMKALMFRGSTLLPFPAYSLWERHSLHLYRQVCGMAY